MREYLQKFANVSYGDNNNNNNNNNNFIYCRIENICNNKLRKGTKITN